MEIIIGKLKVLLNNVYNELGPGYNEVIYHRAFEVELRLNGINYESEVVFPIKYKEISIGNGRIDLLIEKNIIIELKAVSNLNNDAIVQIKNYMKHNLINFGLLVNFGQPTKTNEPNILIKEFVLNEIVLKETLVLQETLVLKENKEIILNCCDELPSKICADTFPN